MHLPLEPWQIPRRPPTHPPGPFSQFVYRVVCRFYIFIRRWYIRLDTERQIKSIGTVGSRPVINGPITILSPQNLVLGKDVNINPGFYAQAVGGIFLGDHLHFGQNVRILTQNHNYDEPECLPYDKVRISKPVTIGDCVWIGDNVCIVPGVTIGEGAIIAMGSVVTHDVPPLAIVGGAPAKVIKMRNEQAYWALKAEGKFLNWPYRDRLDQTISPRDDSDAVEPTG